jgi:UDP-N-acetylmuramoylalanine--D-glutamate ligase
LRRARKPGNRDGYAARELGESVEKLQAAGVQLQLGGYSDAILHLQQLVIPSPGVPADAPVLVKARELGIPVWSEIELASQFLRGRLIGITGSNGKTTTTALVAQMLRYAGFYAQAAGNIGTPLIALADQSAMFVAVAELSSSTGADRNFRPGSCR